MQNFGKDAAVGSSRKRVLLRRLEKCGLTRFQKDVLRATLEIPTGKVMTYKQIANAIGHLNAYRAVGTVLKNNQMAPEIPCHRVIRSDGRIGNYSAGGTIRKRQLLKMEGVRID